VVVRPGSLFVGRARELRKLSHALATAHEGRSATVVIGGAAGIGKSRLVREFLAGQDESGVTVLKGGCVDCGDSPLPFGPVIEALRPLAGRIDPRTRQELLDPVREELDQLLPTLEPAIDGAPVAHRPGGSRSQLFERILSLLEQLSASLPVVLVVEDLHWSDRSTRDLLAFLVPNLSTARVALVLTYRSDELVAGDPFRRTIAQLDRSDGVIRMTVPGLDRAELAAHLDDLASAPTDPALVDTIWTRSQGNPFYAAELLAAAEQGDTTRLPESLRDILAGRLAMLSAVTRKLVRLAAAGGAAVDHRVLSAVARLPEEELYDGLREAIAHQVLLTEDDTGCYTFGHALLREVAYGELLPGERRTVHSHYGRALSELAPVLAPQTRLAAALARHYREAGETAAALRASIEAAADAEAVQGFAESHAHHEQAVALWPQVEPAERPAGLGGVDLHERAAAAADLAGDHHRAAELARMALAAAEAGDDPGHVPLLRERLGRYLRAAGQSEEALRVHARAAADIGGAPPSAAGSEILASFARSLLLAARHRESLGVAREALAQARAVGARAEEAGALTLVGSNLVVLGDPDAGAAHLQEALAVAEELGDADAIATGYRDLASTLSGPLNRLDDALDVAWRGVAKATELGLERHYGVSLRSIAADTLFRLGRWDEAEEELGTAMARASTGVAALDLHLAHGKLAVGRGRFEAAHEHLRKVSSLSARAIDLRFKVPMWTLAAGLALWEGRLDDACAAVDHGLDHVRETDDVWFVTPLLWHGLRAQAERAEAARARRDDDELADAISCGEALRGRSTELRRSGPQQGVLRAMVAAYDAMCAGEMARIVGLPDPAVWATVARAWDELGHPYPAAYARWRQAEMQLASPKRSAGTALLLRQAYATADRLGALPLRREVERLARRARIVVGDDPAAVHQAPAPLPAVDRRMADARLTPREVQVLGLLGEGRSNREIATTLFISEKTASVHVSNILAKLGVRSRVEAATMMHRLEAHGAT
jgi:DNA-binding CsgD family transcriptional regulator/tetratricopeptide (TPR) repeat protein